MSIVIMLLYGMMAMLEFYTQSIMNIFLRLMVAV